MADPFIHAKSSAKRWGGAPEEYLEIHEKMDCQKGYFPDVRGRALTHTSFWIMEVMVPIFGRVFTTSSGREVPLKDICEMHILEDYGMRFIPTPQDFLENMEVKSWMNNGIVGCPASHKKILEKNNARRDTK